MSDPGYARTEWAVTAAGHLLEAVKAIQPRVGRDVNADILIEPAMQAYERGLCDRHCRPALAGC